MNILAACHNCQQIKKGNTSTVISPLKILTFKGCTYHQDSIFKPPKSAFSI